MTVDIRQAGPEFAGVLAVLHGACLSPAWRETAIAGLLASPGGRAWTATLAGRPIGFAMVRQAADEAEILAIGVLQSERRSGIGRALLAAVIEDCRTDGTSRLYLEVAASNSAARRAYEASGFVSVGGRRGYYRTGGTTEDAIIMRRDLM